MREISAHPTEIFSHLNFEAQGDVRTSPRACVERINGKVWAFGRQVSEKLTMLESGRPDFHKTGVKVTTEN